MINRLACETFIPVAVRPSDRIGRHCWWVAREVWAIASESMSPADDEVLGESYTLATRVWVLARERSTTPELIRQLGRFARGLGRLAGVREDVLPVCDDVGD